VGRWGGGVVGGVGGDRCGGGGCFEMGRCVAGWGWGGGGEWLGGG